MEKLYYTARAHLLQFKLDYCCWFAPVRVGLTFVGICNIIVDIVCLIGIANEGYSPTITQVQEILIEDYVSKPIPLIAYVTELGMSVLLLCAIFRRDLVLMRVYMYYTLLAITMSFLIYSIVIAAVPVQIQLAIVFSTLFQIYTILVIRSVMVEIKMENKHYEPSKLVISSLVHEKAMPNVYYTKNGELQEVKIIEVPKKQDVVVTVVEKNQDNSTKTATKVVEVKKEPESKDKPLKKDVVITLVEPKNITEEKNNEKEFKGEKSGEKESKKNESEGDKLDEKKLKEQKKKEEKKAKEEKKIEEKKLKEEKKKEEKKAKEEKKLEEKKLKEDKKSKEKNVNDEKTDKNEESKTEPKESEIKDTKKNVKETWLKTVTEPTKE